MHDSSEIASILTMYNYTAIKIQSTQAVRKIWKEHNQLQNHNEAELTAGFLSFSELVVDGRNKLVQLNRLPGENEVRSSWL